MAYMVAADFRSATRAAWVPSTNVLEVSDVGSTELGSLITEMSNRLDEMTDDHFESSGAGTVILVNSIGGSELWVPKRIQAITKLETLFQPTTFVTENTSAYGYEAFTGDMRQIHKEDLVKIVAGIGLSGGPSWPNDRQCVRITGTFDWPTTPPEVKRAVALMVWDAVKAMGDYAQRATRLSNNDGVYEGFGSLPPKAADIVERFSRQPALVG